MAVFAWEARDETRARWRLVERCAGVDAQALMTSDSSDLGVLVIVNGRTTRV